MNLPQRQLEQDTPVAVRKAFFGVFVLAGAHCLLPRQWVSAGILLSLALVTQVYHRIKLRKERAANSLATEASGES